MRNEIAESKSVYVLKAPNKTDPCDQFATPQEGHAHVQPALQQCMGAEIWGRGAGCKLQGLPRSLFTGSLPLLHWRRRL